ncbi:hypothetical protein [Larkinella rosea]|uniref:Uncharacterized protein n=1 Tax=Larkinella rosea TaxID=2025312 RepID=A0A3P1C1X5_9BACT|nr:hypothetical protein [Larkinella rosea]RRB06804.1 hypothetical protein EHT25_03155 [Larkinella rosea]
MWKHLAPVASTLLFLAVSSCQIDPKKVSSNSLNVALVGIDGNTLVLNEKADASSPLYPVRRDDKGVYYGSRLTLTPDQLSQMKKSKNPAVLRLLYDEKNQFLMGEAYPIAQYLNENVITLPGEQLITAKAFQWDYQLLDAPIPLTFPMIIKKEDLINRPWTAYARLVLPISRYIYCFVTKETPCELERCLKYPPEFNFESIEILANSGPAIIKTLTSADCAISLTAAQAFLTSGPSATFKVRAYVKRLKAAPAGPAPTYSFRYSNSSLPSRLEASHLVPVDLSSLATLAVGSTQLVEFQLSWLLPMAIGPKDFFVVNNATFDAIVAKGGCATPNTMQHYAEDRFRFNLNGAPGGCL